MEIKICIDGEIGRMLPESTIIRRKSVSMKPVLRNSFEPKPDCSFRSTWEYDFARPRFDEYRLFMTTEISTVIRIICLASWALGFRHYYHHWWCYSPIWTLASWRRAILCGLWLPLKFIIGATSTGNGHKHLVVRFLWFFLFWKTEVFKIYLLLLLLLGGFLFKGRRNTATYILRSFIQD